MSKRASGARGERDQKRQQFQTDNGRPRGTRWFVVLGIIAAIGALVGVGLMRGLPRSATSDSSANGGVRTVTASAEGQVRIPTADLESGVVQFYEYAAGSGRKIRFLALKGRDAVHRASLDACEICYHAKKGYFQRGEELVCRQCGNSYAPALIDESPGGCHPMALPRSIDGQDLVILASDIERIDTQLSSQPSPVPRSRNNNR